MSNLAVHFSSATDQWATPLWLFQELNKEFEFTLDVCALPYNAKCSKYFTPDMNGLLHSWAGETCWMNPPYGREIGLWVEKAFWSSILECSTVCCLLPARTDTRWWHDYCVFGEIRFLRGRLKFGDAKNSAPFPSAIVIFNRQVISRVRHTD